MGKSIKIITGKKSEKSLVPVNYFEVVGHESDGKKYLRASQTFSIETPYGYYHIGEGDQGAEIVGEFKYNKEFPFWATKDCIIEDTTFENNGSVFISHIHKQKTTKTGIYNSKISTNNFCMIKGSLSNTILEVSGNVEIIYSDMDSVSIETDRNLVLSRCDFDLCICKWTFGKNMPYYYGQFIDHNDALSFSGISLITFVDKFIIDKSTIIDSHFVTTKPDEKPIKVTTFTMGDKIYISYDTNVYELLEHADLTRDLKCNTAYEPVYVDTIKKCNKIREDGFDPKYQAYLEPSAYERICRWINSWFPI